MENNIENNRLIAEFMGTTLHPSQLEMPHDHYTCYHSSWDWLMPVVEKIDQTKIPNGDWFLVSINTFKTSIIRKSKLGVPYLQEEIYFEKTGRLSNTYSACVEFIKWYNEQQNYDPNDLGSIDADYDYKP